MKTTTLTIAFLLLISLVSASSFQTKVQLEIDSITGVSELDNSDGTSLLITITNSTGVVVSRNAAAGVYKAGSIIPIIGEKFSLDYATDYTYNLSTSYGDFLYSFSTPAVRGGIEYRHCYDEGNCDGTNACQSRMTIDDYWYNNTNWTNGREGENCGNNEWICEAGVCGGIIGASCSVDDDCLGECSYCNDSNVCEPKPTGKYDLSVCQWCNGMSRDIESIPNEQDPYNECSVTSCDRGSCNGAGACWRCHWVWSGYSFSNYQLGGTPRQCNEETVGYGYTITTIEEGGYGCTTSLYGQIAGGSTTTRRYICVCG